MTRTLFLAATSALILSACATAVGPEATTRFDAFSASATSDFTGYDRVYLAPVVASEDVLDRVGYRTRGPSDRTRPLTQKDIDARLEDLTDDLKNALGRTATLADGPGDDILTIAVVLTDLEANRPTMADMSNNPGLSMDSRYSGGGAAQITFSENGNVLATARDGNVGEERLELTSPGIWGETNQFFYSLSQKISALLG